MRIWNWLSASFRKAVDKLTPLCAVRRPYEQAIVYIAYVINNGMCYSLLLSQSEAAPIDGYGYV